MTSFVDLRPQRAMGNTAFSLVNQIWGRAAAAVQDLARRRASALADERFLERATHDPRLLAELQAAIARHQSSS
ncbi:hypothetical protein LJR290_000574 [Variovorax sp. LjRoot290]|uniref:hypothetical protein n=1 Tax=unclassified Variovorax TaxID=663243 RepID=UPI00088129A0|nr:hypothetical protein [Variovorax sp. CF079]SDC92948.1 hypothetical protein SAMN05444679_106138 [Variovorax sp. CF079]